MEALLCRRFSYGYDSAIIRMCKRACSTRCVVVALISVVMALCAVYSTCDAAVYHTANFSVHADDYQFASRVGDAAEIYRARLAELWLGERLPRWSRPCVVTVQTAQDLVAGGETSFKFDGGEVFGWKMSLQGSQERILDSVLPHEVTHTIIASYLRAPAPRWLDEGMATSVEADEVRTHYRKMLVSFVHNQRGIPFNKMVAMKDYPEDLTPFYSQSFSICEYLILVGGRRRLMEFAKTAMQTNDWNRAVKEFYDCESLGALQLEWVGWLKEWDLAGCPAQLPNARSLPEWNDMSRGVEQGLLANNSRVNSASNNVLATTRVVPNTAANGNEIARGQVNPPSKPSWLFPGLTTRSRDDELNSDRRFTSVATDQRGNSANTTTRAGSISSQPNTSASQSSAIQNNAGNATIRELNPFFNPNAIASVAPSGMANAAVGTGRQNINHNVAPNAANVNLNSSAPAVRRY